MSHSPGSGRLESGRPDSYGLGVDLGTTFVAAATAQESRVEMFTLGDRTVVTPAVVFARDDGLVITGEAANRRAVSNPERVGREFKRRLGDPTPVVLGGDPHAVTALLAALLDDAVARVTAAEGAPPERVALTYPANWGPHQRELFEEVPQLAGVADAVMVTEPQAAAAHFAAARHLGDGDTIAVYDLGGSTFEATVLRKRGIGIDILGTPEGIERLGGVDFDDAILAYINHTSGGVLSDLDLSNPETDAALVRLRRDCGLVKEALSVDTEATIPVFLPNRHFDVRLTRGEFEDMIRTQLESTIGVLTRTLRSADVGPADLSAVLLVGGSSRIPLVARMISETLGRLTVVDTHPKYAVALGAATLAAATAPSRPAPVAPGPAPPEAVRVAEAGYRNPMPPEPLTAPDGTAQETRRRPPPETSPTGTRRTRRAGGAEGRHRSPTTARSRRRPVGVAAVAALVLLAATLGYMFTHGHPDVPLSAAAEPSANPLPPPAQRPPDRPPTTAVSVPIPAVGGQIPVGPTPGFVALTPNGKFAYVANRAAGFLTVVDTAVDKVVATIPVPEGPPQYLAFAPDGTRLYVSVFNDPDRSINRVAVLDTQTNTVLTTIRVGTRPYALAVKPDGSELYVPNHDSGTVSVIDTTSNTVVTDIQVEPNPHWVEFSKDGARAYTANHESNLVNVIDTATREVVAEIPVQRSPHSVAIHPTQPLLGNVNYDSNSVTVIDTTTDEVLVAVVVGMHPQDVAWAPDGRHLYVTNVDSDTLTVIAVNGYRVTATVPTGKSATSIAVLPDGTKAYVSNLDSGTLTVLDLTG